MADLGSSQKEIIDVADLGSSQKEIIDVADLGSSQKEILMWLIWVVVKRRY